MHILKAGDWFVIGAVGLAILLLVLPDGDAEAGVVAYIDSASGTAGPHALNRSQTIDYSGPLGVTVVEIEPLQARVASSPCRHQICVNDGWISRAGQVSACLPNRVFLYLAGVRSPSNLDAVSQ